MKKIIVTTILIFFILGAYLYKINTIPGFNGDDAWFMSKSLDIEKNGLLKNIGGMGNYTGVLHPFLIRLINIFFADIIFSGRFLNILSLLFIIFLILRLLKMSVNFYLIIMVTLIFAFHPFNFGFNRVAWPHSLLPLFSIAGLYLFAKYMEKGKIIYIGGALMLAGLGAQLHPIMALQVAYYIFYILIYKRQLAKKILFSRIFIILAICFAIGSFSVLFFNLSAINRLFGMHINNVKHYGISGIFTILTFRFIEYSKIFIHNFTGLRTIQYFSGFLYTNLFLIILLYIFSAALFITAAKNCFRKNNSLSSIFGLHTIFFFFVIPMFLEFGGFNMHILKSGEERIFLIMTPVIFFNYIIFVESLHGKLKKLFLIFSVLILLINIFNISYNYFYNFNTTGGNGYNCYYINEKDLKQIAAEYISANYSPAETIIFVQDYWIYWPLKIYLYKTQFKILYSPKCRIPREGWPEINDFNELYEKYKSKQLLFLVWNFYKKTPIQLEIDKTELIKTINKKDGSEILFLFRKNNAMIKFDKLIEPLESIYSMNGAQGEPLERGFKALLLQHW